jgi:hypothetical protein
MRGRPIAICVAAAALVVPPPAALAVTASGTAVAARAAAPFSNDSALSDARWKTAVRMSDFTDATTRLPGRSKTAVALYYDDANLYVAFWCEQSAPITSLQSTNNIGFGTDDYVGVGIDPTGNADRAYYFEITPIGTRFQQASENARYQPQWQGSARIASGEWTAMMIIPLDVLRLPPADVQTWRVNFVRFVARDVEKLTWGYNGQMDTGNFPSLADARYWPSAREIHIARHTFRPRPSVAAYVLGSGGQGRSQFVSPEGASFTQNPRTTGLDLTYPLTPTMSFVGALSPDFSNVDADQLTITPQVFQRNLTEYRPFFAQGANYINNSATAFGINEPPNLTFYSPSIGTFDRGFKVEGTFGKYQSLGLLEARGTNEITHEPFDDMAFGYKHVLPSRTFGYWTNGAIANHDGTHDATVEFGVQARDLRTGWVGAIFHERETGTLIPDASQAISTTAFIDHQGPTHEGLLGFRDIGPLYHPVDGFTVISDIRGPAFSYSVFGAGPPSSPIKDGNIYLFWDRYFDRSGAVHKADAGFSAFADLKNNYSISLGTTQTELRSYDGNFQTGYPFYRNPRNQRFDVSYAGLTYRPNSPAPINAQYSWGPFGDYYLQQINSSMTRPLGTRYTFSLEYDGTLEHFYSGPADGQWLRRVSFGWSIDRNSTLSVALRNISGTGGFASPGTNLSASLHRLFESGDELYLSFGTPASTQTVNRFLVKYVFKRE